VALDRLAVDGLRRALLGGEVVVERALGHAGVGGDDVEARLDAVGGEAAIAASMRRARVSSAAARVSYARVHILKRMCDWAKAATIAAGLVAV
jgi:hypothetical protein